eukprot:CAMPEP_0194279276 /NCGR_PEP_ID=MMETSP0169-20130528/13838_1 /TAXON_ID=218684 /ORGANISM="Corethron pennatum, Strain L29A3" /LENGTH=289 /DNA_ID=CAMNT_0039023679 /DNA_START=164 /DNA_END=1033 /DNA_ORIENTATION=-
MGKTFVVNGVTIDLPKSGTVTKKVAEAVCKIILLGARKGIGENTPCKGMIVIVGSKEKHYKSVGNAERKYNKFEGKDLKVEECLEGAGLDFVLDCFIHDLALFVDGKSGTILADRYMVNLDMKDVDTDGGSKHKAASAAGRVGCLAIKCSEDCCTTGGGKGYLKVFSGTKTPKSVLVEDKDNPFAKEKEERRQATKKRNAVDAFVEAWKDKIDHNGWHEWGRAGTEKDILKLTKQVTCPSNLPDMMKSFKTSIREKNWHTVSRGSCQANLFEVADIWKTEYKQGLDSCN